MGVNTSLGGIGLGAIVKTDVFEYKNPFSPLTSGKITDYYLHCERVMRDSILL